jgi:hypothetical protein
MATDRYGGTNRRSFAIFRYEGAKNILEFVLLLDIRKAREDTRTVALIG